MIIKDTNRNFNRTFDEIFNSFPSSWGSDTKSESVIPPVNILETTEAYNIELIAPGKSKEDFQISIDKGILTVKFEQKQEEENKAIKTIRREFVSRSFKRSFSIDEKIDTENIQARYENGILYLSLPKKEEVKNTPKQIQIQ